MIDHNSVTDEMVDQVEHLVGMGSNAWDCVDPKEIIAAAIMVWDRPTTDLELTKSQDLDSAHPSHT